MKITLLGSGTSTGVPRIDGDWGVCDPTEPRNRRTRVSVIVESEEGAKLLVDTTPDMRQQFLANAITAIDAVFWTHDHADHCHGIDDLRALRGPRSAPIPGYALAETVHRLRQRFGYVFAGQYGYSTLVQIEALANLRMCAGLGVAWCEMPHGPTFSTGYRFSEGGKSIGYATDYSAITDDMLKLFDGVDILVTDCLRRDPHPSHAHLSMALDFAKRCGARRTVLTHLDKSMDYRELSDRLPKDVLVGFDGLSVSA